MDFSINCVKGQVQMFGKIVTSFRKRNKINGRTANNANKNAEFNTFNQQ